MYTPRNSKKKITIALVIVALVVAGLGTIAFNLMNKPTAPTTTDTPLVDVPTSGIKYPSGWQELSQISLAEQQNGTFSVATRQNPGVSAVVEQVSGSLVSDFDIKDLPAKVESKLKTEVNGLVVTKKSIEKIGGFDAAKIVYTTTTDSLKYENIKIIIPTAQRTYYLTYQSLDKLSDASADINAINQSLGNYIKAQLSE